MKYRKDIAAALYELEKVKESPSDILLVHLTRGQRLVERIEQGLDFDPALQCPEATAPAVLYVKAFAGEINRARQAVPPEFKKNGTHLWVGYEMTKRQC